MNSLSNWNWKWEGSSINCCHNISNPPLQRKLEIKGGGFNILQPLHFEPPLQWELKIGGGFNIITCSHNILYPILGGRGSIFCSNNLKLGSIFCRVQNIIWHNRHINFFRFYQIEHYDINQTIAIHRINAMLFNSPFAKSCNCQCGDNNDCMM